MCFHTDGHTRGEAVRIKEDVGRHATLWERHVFNRPLLTADAFLSVTTGELVANDGVSYDSQDHNDTTQQPRTMVIAKHLQALQVSQVWQ